ncbi:MAG: cytochrome C oxidase subunit IV family protein [Candidatus Caldarchaeum sp.]
MKLNVYIGVWAVLMLATVLELAMLRLPMTLSLIVFGIMGLAFMKAVLIALFYQHLLTETRWIKLLYAVAALTAVGLVVGMVTSIVR